MVKIIHNVGNMVDVPSDSQMCLHDSDNSVIFVGKMSYEPNIVAVSYFATNIFPKLKSIFPNILFTIIGANPDGRVQKLGDIEGITVTGFVDSVEPYFQNSTIVVAPMLTGAGIQNKIIQAMSYGCCVATSPIGAEGLTINNQEIEIYNNDIEWISGLQQLLTNKEMRKQMGYRAREYVKNNLSKEIIAKQFWTFIDSAIKEEQYRKFS